MNELVRPQDARPPVAHRPYAREFHPADHDETLDLRRFVGTLLRRRWQILLVMALAVIPAMVATFLAEPRFRSSVLVQIDPEPVQVLPYRELEVTRPQYDTFMKTQEHVLTGQPLVSRVAERLRKESDTAAGAEVLHLATRLSVQRLENTQIFRLSYEASRPDVAARVANTFAEEYIKLQFQGHQQTRQRARQLLERELATLEQRVQASEKQLVNYALDHNIQRAEPTHGDLAQDKLMALARQVTDAETETLVARAQLESMQRAGVRDFPEKLVTPVIAGRVSALLQLEHDLTRLRASFGENWPAVVQKRNEIALVRRQLEQEKAAALTQAQEQAQLDYMAADRKRSMLVDARTEQEQLVNQLQNASIQYNIIRREVETNQKLYEGLLERLRQTGVTSGMELGNIHVIEPALPRSSPVSPRPWWNLMVASVLGLSLGITFALARDFWGNSMATVEDVEHVTVLPVLASVPFVRTRRTARSVGAGRAGLGLLGSRSGSASPSADTGVEPAVFSGLNLEEVPFSAEAIRTLCASILLSRSEHPPRLMVVTSALPDEGKTTLAVQMGRAFAEHGARTLLVECDMRRPAFGSHFGIGAEGGLSLFLAGHLAQAEVHQTKHDRLFVVGAGPTAPNPVVLLNSEKMSAFLRDMSALYQFVILDTPPVLPMADARVLGAKADGVVVVVRAGRTSRNLLRRVCTVLEQAGANVLGAVLNCADPRDLERSYYGSYRGYYGRSH